MVVPAALAPAFATGMEELYRSSQVPLQATMAAFIDQGHFNAHIRRMRMLYGSRLELLQRAVASEFPDARVHAAVTDAGLHLALHLPDGCDGLAVMRSALQRGIAVRPLSRYYYRPAQATPGLVLGYACVESERIAPSFAQLAQAIGAHLS